MRQLSTIQQFLIFKGILMCSIPNLNRIATQIANFEIDRLKQAWNTRQKKTAVYNIEPRFQC